MVGGAAVVVVFDVEAEFVAVGVGDAGGEAVVPSALACLGWLGLPLLGLRGPAPSGVVERGDYVVAEEGGEAHA